MMRLALVVLPAFGVVGVLFTIAIVVPGYLRIQHFPSASAPQQPIAFDHKVHVEQAGLDCAFCHRTASQGITAGYPDVEQCIGCHVVTALGGRSEEIEKVRQAWIGGKPIDWERLHRLPDHTRFPHAAHVQAGVDCADCHGAVDQMGQVVQVRSLKMGDCVDCHRERTATDQCGACHY
jgi:hypothetical protein